METPENQNSVADDFAELRDQHESLRHLINSVLMLVIVISGTMTVFLFRQNRFMSQELEAVRARHNNAVSAYKVVSPQIDDFERRLAEYARTHPDFAPVLAKYRKAAATASSSNK